ncbi:MAG TPA: hypothetical protein VD967_02780 [Candidatus Paceibacterota bacterium]|nr:hypothetical protein [Candidatus Paceibacterota bacterium]
MESLLAQLSATSLGQYLIFFGVGFFQDLLITLYYQAISKDYPFRSGFLSFVVTVVGILVLYEILGDLEGQQLGIILAYALGNGVGTYVVVKGKHFKKKGHLLEFFMTLFRQDKTK